MKKLILLSAVLAISFGAMPMLAQASILAEESIGVNGTGGLGGTGTGASDMVFQSFVSGNTGWGWAGGAGGVQGNQSITNSGGNATAANEALSFNIGSVVTSLNSQYGAGNWTVSNLSLAFTSSYASEGNNRFGLGSGTYDIYWVANNNWSQATGTASSDPASNPPYTTSAAGLATWSPQGTADLASGTFTVPTTGQPNYNSGSVNISNNLVNNTSSLVNEILTSSATGEVSLYLMATSPTLGMLIFTGGQGAATPTLSFEVDSATPTPIPAAAWLLGSGLFGLVGLKRKNVTA